MLDCSILNLLNSLATKLYIVRVVKTTKYLQKNRMPSWDTNCIEDWETKVNTIVEETFHENMTVISGIPSWVQMYFEKLYQKGGKPVGEIFKNFNLRNGFLNIFLIFF